MATVSFLVSDLQKDIQDIFVRKSLKSDFCLKPVTTPLPDLQVVPCP